MAVGMSMPGVRLSYRIRRILDSRRPARVSRLRLACAIAACAAATAISTAATLAQASSRVFESAAARRLGSPLTPLTRSDPAERATGSLDATYARGRAGAPPAKMHVDSVRQVSSPVPALMSSDPVERAAAACELGRLGSPTVIPLLIALLGDGAPLPRQIFCGTEPPFEDESWAPDYPEVLEPSPGEAATRALIALGDRAIAPLTETLAAAGDWRARKNAAWALAHRGQATAALTAALRDSAWQVRSEAAYALFQRGGNSRDVVEALSSALTDSAWQVREQATLALGSKGGPDTDVIEALLLALRDRSSRVRLAATAALCQRAESRAWTALLEALRDPDQSVRAGAARAIGSRARDPEVQLLIAARHDPDPRTREGAMEALRIVDQRMRGTTTNLTRIPIPFD